MNHDDLVFEAMNYRRNVGADLDSIRAYVGIRGDKKRTSKDDKESLARLQKDGIVVRVGEQWFLTPEAYKQARGTALAPELESTDAWILLALLYNHGKIQNKLEDIIATADGINHAIPTHEEIHGALNRLDAARLIKLQRGAFIVTDAALNLFSKVQASCKQYILDQLDCLRRLMNCPCCGIKLKAVRWRINIGASEYKSAVESYSRRFQGMLDAT
jgi:hypothetical protein